MGCVCGRNPKTATLQKNPGKTKLLHYPLMEMIVFRKFPFIHAWLFFTSYRQYFKAKHILNVGYFYLFLMWCPHNNLIINVDFSWTHWNLKGKPDPTHLLQCPTPTCMSKSMVHLWGRLPSCLECQRVHLEIEPEDLYLLTPCLLGHLCLNSLKRSSFSYTLRLRVTSGEGLTVTLINAGSAAGQAIPPCLSVLYLVFPRAAHAK